MKLEKEKEVIFSAWRFIERSASVAEAEALACVEGLRWAVEWRVPQVIIELDCARIVVMMGNAAESRSDLSLIIAGAKGLAQQLNCWKISQVKRDGNHVANTLARLARQCKQSAAWLGRAPACAWDPINADCNGVPV
jgi:ribonuclease HI